MFIKSCFGLFGISAISFITESLILEQNVNTLIILAITGAIMCLAIVIIEAMKRIQNRA